MAALTVVTARRSTNGNDLAGVAAAAGGDTFVNTGKEVLLIKNASGAPITLTVVVPATVDGLAVADRTVVIPATTGFMMVGPFPPGIYNDTLISGGIVSLTYSGVTTLTVNVVQINPNA